MSPGDGGDGGRDGLAAAREVVGARWARLLVGARRVAELGIPTNILATRLTELQAAGVVARILLFHNSRAYTLTERGQRLRLAVEALRGWGGETITTDEAAPA